jgi:hypothetical protein
MPETFHGAFDLEIIRLEDPTQQQLLIKSGGTAETHPAALGLTLSVGGDEWTVEPRYWWPGEGWHESHVRRDVEFTVEQGLVYVLRVQVGLLDSHSTFHNMWIKVTSTDPDVNPMYPPEHPPDFTIPKSAVGEG